MRENKLKLSRRDFLKEAGLTGAGLAAAGALASCAPKVVTENPEAASTAESSGSGAAQSGWKTPPAEITNFAKEYTFDAVAVGHGYAGVTAIRELAEQGLKVALIERQTEDGYMAMGNESMAINSKVLDRLTAYNPVPHVDMVEYMDNWMTMVGNQANPGLIMRFCQNEADNIDWYYDRLTDEDFATVTHTSWPKEGETWEHILPNIGPIKFWPGTFSCYGECNQTKVQGYNRQAAKDKGAEFFFNTIGEQIVMSGGKVAGVIAKQGEEYIKFNCKAVILATGGFSYNNEMLKDLLPDLYNALVGDEGFNKPAEPGAFSLSNPNANGDGVKMAYWAGAHLETLPVAGMNAKHIQPPAGMTNLPQSVWVRGDGKRFCNEFYPIVEHRGIPNVYMPRDPVHCVFDNDFTTYRSYYVPQHGGMEPSASAIAGLREAMDKAYSKFKGTWVEPTPDPNAQQGVMGPMMSIDYIADDTLEGLAGQLGLTGAAATEFIAQIERYNKYCDQGVDQEFGRYKEVLFPVKNGPFYAASGNPGLGELMCTMGGIITDADQNALDKDFKPIPGLYVSGNDCGRRFGIEYITPTPGVSLAMAITLGREAGKSMSKFLKA
jgi:succinate dehydrogenase/fumarate reductase flavoprotein subunit